jgi:hypothetical protein
VTAADTTVDQISPLAIKQCALCQQKNGALGGRTKDGRFHPAYTHDASQIGRLAWCGRNGPEHLLRVVRIVCTRVEVDGERLPLCQRCARDAIREQQREGVAA